MGRLRMEIYWRKIIAGKKIVWARMVLGLAVLAVAAVVWSFAAVRVW